MEDHKCKTFKGRPVLPGNIEGEILVSREGFNTLASYKTSIMTHSWKATCSDQGNPDLYKKDLKDRILCLPATIGSTTGGLIFMNIVDMGLAPRALCFSRHIDSLAAAGVILSDIWQEHRIVTVDSLGDEFLSYAQEGMMMRISEDGTVTLYQ